MASSREIIDECGVKIDNAQKISKTHEMSHMIKIHKKEKRDKKKKKIMRWIYLPT